MCIRDRIRFSIDTKDGEDATKLIQKAKLMQLTEKERERLSSLERFANQFIPKEKTETAADPVQVCREIDTVVEEIGVHHGEMKPLTKELLKSPKPNLPFNQVRWMAYNERWTEKHGYLDYDIAKFGASPQNESRTRERAHRGEDVGRHNTIGHTTEGQNYMRKTEVVRHSATFEHLDVSDQTATLQLAEWCKYPRSPKDLYWRTLCCHSKGEPKPSNWHEDWYLRLTKLRSLTRTLEKSNVRYVGEGMDPVPLSGAGLVAPAKSAPTNEATASNAMAL